MSKRHARILLAAIAAALAAVLGGTTALAATSWTVTPGGAFSGRGPLKLGPVTCNAVIKGQLRGGKGPGSRIGSVTSLVLSSCTSGPLGPAFVVKAHALPWFLNAVTYNSGSGVTAGSLSGIKITLSGAGCAATVAGATASSKGTLKLTYANSTGKLTTSGGGNLHVFNVDGCAGLFNSGDAIAMSFGFPISPSQQITSP